MAWSEAYRNFKRNEIVGKRFGKLVVLEFEESKGVRLFYKCKCDCGKVIVKRKDRLNMTSSCGCAKGELISKAVKKAKNSRKTNFEELDKLTFNELLDKEPYEAIQVIKKFKKVDYYKAKDIYADWRKKVKVDPEYSINK